MRKLLNNVTDSLDFLKHVPDSYGPWVLNTLRTSENPLDALTALPKKMQLGAGVPTLGPMHAGPSPSTGSASYGSPSEYKDPSISIDPIAHEDVPMSLRPGTSHQQPP